MYPVIYDDSNNKLGVLNNIIKESARIKQVVNGEFLFSFEAYEAELKSEYLQLDNVVVANSQSFDIKYLEQLHDTAVKYRIEAEHVIYRLEDGAGNVMTPNVWTGTPTSILTTLLAGTDFTLGTVDFVASTTLTLNQELSRKQLIYQFINELGGEIEFSNNGFTVNVLNSIGADNGFEARLGKNLKSIKKIIDGRGDLRTYYEIDLLQLKNSNEYILKSLQDLEVIEVGDTIQIIDDVLGIDVSNRVISIEYNPIFEKNTALEIANEIELITDSVNTIDTTTVKLSTAYNQVQISTEFGFRATRDDSKAKVEMNATEGISIYTDVGAGYVKNFYVDVNGRIQANAIDIVGTGTFGGRIIINDGANDQVDIFEDASGGYSFYYDNGGDRVIQLGSEPTDQYGLVLVYNGAGTASPEDDVRAEMSVNPTSDHGRFYINRTARQNSSLWEGNSNGGFLSFYDTSSNTVAFIGTNTSDTFGYLLLRDGAYTHSQISKDSNGGTLSLMDTVGNIKSLIRNNGTSYLSNSDLAIGGTTAAGYALHVTGDQRINDGSLLVERDSSGGGFVFVNNAANERAIQFGLDSGYSYQPGLMLLYNGATSSQYRMSLGVDSTNDRGTISIYNGGTSQYAYRFIYNASGDALMNMYDASGNLQTQFVADGNNYINNRLSVGNNTFITDYSINTEEGIRCPYIRLVELSADPSPTADGVMFVKTNKLYVILAGTTREVALV